MDYNLPVSEIHGILQEEHWSGLPSASPGDLPNPVIEPRSPALQADGLPSEPPGKGYHLTGDHLNQQQKAAEWVLTPDLTLYCK